MKEFTVASRWNQNWKQPYNVTIQLLRDTLEWDKDEGFTMAGTWEGLLPENGLYSFEPYSSVKFISTKENVLKKKDVLMYVTFNTDNTWQAVDFWYKQTVGGTYTIRPGVKTADIASFFHYAFVARQPWFTIGGYDLSDNHLTNQIPYDFKAFTPHTALFDVLNNDYYGYGACYGGRVFVGRSINYRYKTDYNLYLLNGTNLDGANITSNEVMDRNSIAYTKNDGESISYRTTYLNATTNNLYQTSAAGSITTTFVNRHSFEDLYRPSTSERKDYVSNPEGTFTEYANGIDRDKPGLTKIILNAIYEPWCGFPSVKVVAGFNPGLMFHPKHINFYEGTTELFAVNYKADKDNG